MPSRFSVISSRTRQPRRGGTPALVALAIALAVLVGGQSLPADGLAAKAAAPPSSTYTTFTLNVLHDLSATKALADMRKALTLGDVGGFQEMSDLEDRQSLAALVAAENWGIYMPAGGGNAIPIVWKRSRFELIPGTERTIMVHPAEEGITPARYLNIVQLREIATGRVFGYINTHTIAQASYDAQATDMYRIPRLRLHLQMLRQEIITLFASTEYVFAGGDLNVNYLADRIRKVSGLPTDALGDLVSFDMPLEGSRGPTSLLDYGMTVKHDGGLVLKESQIVHDFYSDHDLVQFRYRVLDLFAAGPLTNLPTGTGDDRRRVLNRITRAVQDAAAGDQVRVATARLDYPKLEQALLAAQAEGVSVQVVLGSGLETAAEARLAAALGADRSAGSWLVRCTDTCLGGNGRMETNVALVSRAGGTTDVTLVSSTPFVADATGRWTDVFRSSSAAVYDAYGQIFERMAQDAGDVTPRVLDLGSMRALLYPVTGTTADPVLRALGKVGCLGARGLRTADGRTNVRVSATAWSGVRGQKIARRLGTLKANGCDVAVVLGPQVKAGVRRTLAEAGVPTRSATVAQQLLVIDGRYDGRAGAHIAWTGGPSWTDWGLGSDGVSLAVPQAASVLGYLNAFSRIWSAS